MALLGKYLIKKTSFLARALVLTLIIGTAPIALIQSVSAAPISVTECKLIDPFQSNVRLGFPKNPSRLNSTGNQNILLMAVDYSDAPATGNALEELKLAFDIEQTNAFFKSVSYDRISLTFEYFPRVVRLPKSSSNYVGQLTGEFPPPIDVIRIMQDATSSISGQINFSNFQAIAILDLGNIEAWGGWGFALASDSPGFSTTSGFIKNSTVIGSSLGSRTNAPPKGYRTSTLIHELGHLFGFVDLYIIKPGNYFIAQTPGPFDVMNAASGEFLGWQRWLQGWVSDSNVACYNFADPATSIQMKPLGKSTTGTQLAVIRISSRKVLVLESRKGTATENLGGNEGLLAYEIDLLVPTLQGPVRIVPKNSPVTLAPLSPDLNDVDRFLDATAQTGQYIRYKDILIENKLGNQDGESIQIYKGNDAVKRQRELDALDKKAQIAEFNTINSAKAKNAYFESPSCIFRGQKYVFQTLGENRVWKDLDVPTRFTSDPTCSSALFSKPYIITQLPSRTFLRGKVTNVGGKSDWFTAVAITDVVPLSDKAQIDLEIALAKLEDNYYQDTTGCYSKGTTATLQIERGGVFVDFAPVTSWVQVSECTGPTNLFRPYVIARLATGTKYRFKSQSAGWDRDYFSREFVKGKTPPEQLADLNTELTALINNLRSEKSQLEGSVATLKSQLVTSNSEIEKLQESIAQQKSSFESISGELITAKTKLEGDVAFLKKENAALKNKVGGATKTTITCVKGSAQKKVTAVKPVCPSGYTKKT
jgi:M6 family metalloprotease-like protein